MKAIRTETGGAILDDSKGVLLPVVFSSQDIAERFLDACERVGFNLWPGMPYAELKQAFDLWYDAWKRPGVPR